MAALDFATGAGDDRDLISELAHNYFSATDETQIEHRFKAVNFRLSFNLKLWFQVAFFPNLL